MLYARKLWLETPPGDFLLVDFGSERRPGWVCGSRSQQELDGMPTPDGCVGCKEAAPMIQAAFSETDQERCSLQEWQVSRGAGSIPGLGAGQTSVCGEGA